MDNIKVINSGNKYAHVSVGEISTFSGKQFIKDAKQVLRLVKSLSERWAKVNLSRFSIAIKRIEENSYNH